MGDAESPGRDLSEDDIAMVGAVVAVENGCTIEEQMRGAAGNGVVGTGVLQAHPKHRRAAPPETRRRRGAHRTLPSRRFLLIGQ